MSKLAQNVTHACLNYLTENGLKWMQVAFGIDAPKNAREIEKKYNTVQNYLTFFTQEFRHTHVGGFMDYTF
jgi:hypothetical protein